jgi:hypothetical protein
MTRQRNSRKVESYTEVTSQAGALGFLAVLAQPNTMGIVFCPSDWVNWIVRRMNDARHIAQYSSLTHKLTLDNGAEIWFVHNIDRVEGLNVHWVITDTHIIDRQNKKRLLARIKAPTVRKKPTKKI